MTLDALALAKQFHDAYERLAPVVGYTTRLDTREFNPDSVNGRLITVVVNEVMIPALAQAHADGVREGMERAAKVLELNGAAWVDIHGKLHYADAAIRAEMEKIK